ncbi:type III restriction-modification system endonuclease [Billgrantia desiderata]|uniref:type III restriction-modification system endonuclease n=1 Tax=Billgrantia desiderata TaxID=52021 RepID=UPI003F39861F
MKIRFKVQPYQTSAVEAVVDCFAGQPRVDERLPGFELGRGTRSPAFDEIVANADFAIDEARLLANVQAVARRQNLPVPSSLTDFTTLDAKGELVPVKPAYRRDALAATGVHLDVEMETGTGKTYCYIKTIFELNKRYGWSKFIVMVPTIAIREGVAKSLEITAEHFAESYGKRARCFVYNSKLLHELESFSSDAGINVMVMNIQAFNARGKDNRRIYDELDDFQSRKPIDVIAANRPILILDEPQKMEGATTLEALPQFKPLMILRYSATHRTRHNRVFRLDALDAYQQKLVKKIAVRGIQTRGLAGTHAYLYLEGIEVTRSAPVVRIELEMLQESGAIVRKLRRLTLGDDLFAASGQLEQYRDGFTISEIDCHRDTVEFTNGLVVKAGEARGDVAESDIRRIQIRETIKAHLDKEKQLFAQGIKVLSLFFIDEVAKYRDYARADEKGEYARIFEEEYAQLKDEYLAELALDNTAYRHYLAGVEVAATHSGYFAIDRKTRRLKDPAVGARSVESDDVEAYDLILKDKERLLSLTEPTRFIFSHSALREGWDNPNVFVMCMLKHSDNSISRRQEVGRGLRLCVDQQGERIDAPAVVHEINVLTVVASESYQDFVTGLQREIADTLTGRPGEFVEAQLPRVEDGRKPKANPLNANFDTAEFQALWRRIGRQAVYRVEFDSDALIRQCAEALDRQLRVTSLQYGVRRGVQRDDLSDETLRQGEGFSLMESVTEWAQAAPAQVSYDLLGRLAERARLTRRTVAGILQRIAPAVFEQYRLNPEHFIAEAARLIHEQKAAITVRHLTYAAVDERYDMGIFTAAQSGQDFSRATSRLNKHVYDYAIVDSEVERRFVQALEASADVTVYAKLPRGYRIPTPMGDYNPDWAICLREGSGAHRHVVVETKGSPSLTALRDIERAKAECARKFFDAIGSDSDEGELSYLVVSDFDELMDAVKQLERA